MTLKNIVYGLCFGLGVSMMTPAYASAEEGSIPRSNVVQVAEGSQAAQVLGNGAELNYQAHDPLLCFKTDAVKADDIGLTTEMNREKAAMKMNNYLTQLSLGDNVSMITLVYDEMGTFDNGGKRFYAPVNPKACAHLVRYHPDITEKILGDADPKERTLANPFMSQASQASEQIEVSDYSSAGGSTVRSSVGQSALSYKDLKMTNLAMPYILAATSLMKGNDFNEDEVFSLWSKFASLNNYVINLTIAKGIYDVTVDSIQKIKNEKKGEHK